MPVEEFCLGIEALGTCLLPAAPLLSLGEGALVAAILYACYRLSPRLAHLRWTARGISARFILVLLGVAYAPVLLAALLRLVGPPWVRVPVIGYPTFWEIAAAGAFVAIAGMLVYTGARRMRLVPANASRIVAASRMFIAHGTDAELAGLGDEIAPLAETAAQQCRIHREKAQREGRAELDEYTRACQLLFESWADARYCGVLVRHCPETVLALFRTLTENGALDDAAALGSELVNAAVSDERSLLYRENQQLTAGRQRPALKAMFGEWSVVASPVRPLASWEVPHDTAVKNRVSLWSDALDLSIDAFLEKGSHGEAVFPIRHALETLNDLTARLLSERERRGASWTELHEPIYEVSRAFRTAIRRIRMSNFPAPVETTVERYDPFQDETLHGAVAEELYTFLGAISSSRDHEFLELASLAPWKELFEEGELNGNIRALRIRMAYHLRRKLVDNLDGARRFGPPVVRVLLVRYALAPGLEGKNFAVTRQLHEYVQAEIAAHLPALWTAHREYAEHLLPDNVDYDEKEGVLTVRHPRRDARTLDARKLKEVRPPEAQSAAQAGGA